jgi:hypothetical protein
MEVCKMYGRLIILGKLSTGVQDIPRNRPPLVITGAKCPEYFDRCCKVWYLFVEECCG